MGGRTIRFRNTVRKEDNEMEVNCTCVVIVSFRKFWRREMCDNLVGRVGSVVPCSYLEDCLYACYSS
jgi:hypothetical protein